jgi:serine/threonine protein kinase
VGFGATGTVFKVLNVKTKETLAIKAIQNTNSSFNSQDIQIGMQLSKTCKHLVRYFSIFEEGDFEIIVMEYFEEGDLQTFLNKVNKLTEDV